jgi:hypothetical protein
MTSSPAFPWPEGAAWTAGAHAMPEAIAAAPAMDVMSFTVWSFGRRFATQVGVLANR